MASCDLKLGLNRRLPESNQVGSTPNKYKFCRRWGGGEEEIGGGEIMVFLLLRGVFISDI